MRRGRSGMLPHVLFADCSRTISAVRKLTDRRRRSMTGRPATAPACRRSRSLVRGPPRPSRAGRSGERSGPGSPAVPRRPGASTRPRHKGVAACPRPCTISRRSGRAWSTRAGEPPRRRHPPARPSPSRRHAPPGDGIVTDPHRPAPHRHGSPRSGAPMSPSRRTCPGFPSPARPLPHRERPSSPPCPDTRVNRVQGAGAPGAPRSREGRPRDRR